jgi:hypothetical protein
MANCKAALNLNQFWIKISSKKDIFESLKSLMDVDNDLTENEEYFRDDTISLGYENEADRIVKELLKEEGYPKTIEDYKKLAGIVAARLSGQEYYGECDIKFTALTNDLLVVAFATGGSHG